MGLVEDVKEGSMVELVDFEEMVVWKILKFKLSNIWNLVNL